MEPKVHMSLAELQNEEAIEKFFDDSMRAFEDSVTNDASEKALGSNRGYKTADEWLANAKW